MRSHYVFSFTVAHHENATSGVREWGGGGGGGGEEGGDRAKVGGIQKEGVESTYRSACNARI